MRWRSERGGESSAGGGLRPGGTDGRRRSARRGAGVAECHLTEQGRSEGRRACAVQQGGRGVNGGEGRTVAWPGGEAVMAPQARRAMVARVPCGRATQRAESGVCALERGGESAAQRCQRSATVVHRAGGSGAASSGARVPCCVRREEERGGERERGERKKVVNGLTRFKLKIFN